MTGGVIWEIEGIIGGIGLAREVIGVTESAGRVW